MHTEKPDRWCFVGGNAEKGSDMNVIQTFRECLELQRGGLSEERIGVRLGLGQWTVSRLLGLRTLESDVSKVFENTGCNVSLSALLEIASYPADIQLTSIADLRKLAEAGAVKSDQVVAVLALRGRDLDRAPFPTTSCKRCYRRTGAQQDLFGEVDLNRLGRCLDAGCFARCMNAVAARRARWPKKKEGAK